MISHFLQSIRLDSFLSFAPGSARFELQNLNVLIGPNGSGKSNFIEAFELLRATAGDFASAVRLGGGAGEWIWKGDPASPVASIDAVFASKTTGKPLRYRLSIAAARQRLEIVDEAVEEIAPLPPNTDVFFYYRFQQGRPVISVRDLVSGKTQGPRVPRHLQREDLAPDQSVLSQRKDPDLYPEITETGVRFGAIQTFREWSFGRYAELRKPQRADLPNDVLMENCANLALVFNRIDHEDGGRLARYMKRFLPGFERISTSVSGGSVQLYLRESGLASPISSTRLSDGTIRFLALLASLLSPNAPSLVCIEEPELGLHPDAMKLVAELLVEASQRTQIVVTTHSDALVSELTDHAESVVICERTEAGTTLRRIESERLSHWLDKYRLGEVWRIGELGGNP